MSSPASFSVFSGLMASVHEGMQQYLPESSHMGLVVLESSALAQISHASAKNVPFSLLKTDYSLPEMFSARVTYLEAGLMCLTSTIHNLFFSIVYSALTVVSLGLHYHLRSKCMISWMHVLYGCIGTGISLVGILKPDYGIGLNFLFIQSIFHHFSDCYEKDVSRFEHLLIHYIQKIANENRETVYNFIKSRQKDFDYINFYEPSLRQIESRIHSARRMQELTNLAWDIYKQWPKMGSLNHLNQDEQLAAAHHHYNHV